MRCFDDFWGSNVKKKNIDFFRALFTNLDAFRVDRNYRKPCVFVFLFSWYIIFLVNLSIIVIHIAMYDLTWIYVVFYCHNFSGFSKQIMVSFLWYKGYTFADIGRFLQCFFFISCNYVGRERKCTNDVN